MEILTVLFFDLFLNFFFDKNISIVTVEGKTTDRAKANSDECICANRIFNLHVDQSYAGCVQNLLNTLSFN